MMKKDTYFFPHDFGARNDPKLQDVLMNHGLEGIGVFWCIIEMLYEQGGSLALNKINAISFQLHAKTEVVENVIKNFGLFDADGTNFWSESVNRRLKKREELTNKRRDAANNRWTNRGNSGASGNENSSAGGNDSKPDDKPGESKPRGKDVDFKVILEMYHSICKSYSRIVKLSEARKNKIRIRFQEMDNSLDTLRQVFEKMEESKFMRGDNKPGWKANFDWVFLNEKNWVKVLEGNYDNKPDGNAGNGKNDNPNDEWT